MSASFDQIVKDLTGVIQDPSKRQTKPYDTTATVVRIEDGTAWVHINGGVDETPAMLTINASVGDTVRVRNSGGKVWITGNATAPPTDDKRANQAHAVATEANDLASKAEQNATRAAVAADSAEAAASAAQTSLKSVVSGATTVEKAVSVMQTALEAIVDYDPENDTTKEYFWHDADGAHVLGDDSGYRNDVTSEGMDIVEVETETSVARFGVDSARIGKASGQNIQLSSEAITFYTGNNSNAYISQDKLFSTNAEVQDAFYVGSYSLRTGSDGKFIIGRRR